MTKRKIIGLSTGGFMILLGIVGLFIVNSESARTNVRGYAQTVLARTYPTPTESFPKIDETNLSATQKQIISVSRTEYAKKPVSFDHNVLTYSQGHKESWCADFASWVMKHTDQRFSNPNSGSWRIPGVSTLQEYFMAEDRYERAGAYTPKVGDVAIYKENRSHTNIVIAVHGNTMTTIGGNENGHLRLNTQKNAFGEQGLSGFGVLKN